MDELFGGLTDFITTQEGDLKVVDNDLGRIAGIDWFAQEVHKILKSANDWFFAPSAGASLDRFHGEVNSRSVAGQIQDVVTNKIKQQGIHIPADLQVRVVPISLEEIKVYINLVYGVQVIPVNSLVFDLQRGFIKDAEVIANQQDPTTPNKHPFATRFL